MSLGVRWCDALGCVLVTTLEIQYNLSLGLTNNFMLKLVYANISSILIKI